MKKIRGLLAYGLLIGGMVYALISIAAVPAAACTPTQCADLDPETINTICEGNFGCLGGGRLVFCNSSGFEAECFTSNGGICTQFGGQCN